MTKALPAIQLKPTTIADLGVLFQFQLDPEARMQAAFMPVGPADINAYITKYSKLINDPTVNNQTIWVGNIIAGSIAKFIMEGEAEITYWIDRQYWRQGLASRALQEFLTLETTRPLVARVAFDNIGSQKLLEKNGFIKLGIDKGFASARKAVIEEYIYRLEAL